MRRRKTKQKPAPARASIGARTQPRFPAWLTAVLLVVATIVLYWPATRHDFVPYDDPDYVTANLHVQSGLNWESVKWAFFNPVSFNWHPLTVLSHMLDCQLFGSEPWGHHLTSLLLHAVNAALVFILLQQMTGAMWRSMFVAALFAVHPLRVESVAWVAERKDVLSGFFGFLSLIFYARYAQASETGSRKPEAGKNSPFSVFRHSAYCYALLFFALGLMSKPMLVTWPFIMLLLDYWPLRRIADLRFAICDLKHLLIEKIPFFALAAVASVVTFLVQQHEGAVVTTEHLPLGLRGGNALISYCSYLEKMFWPTKLAVYYPLTSRWPGVAVLLAGGLIASISVSLFLKRRNFPYLLTGWLWYVGTLVPVIGLVQVGGQAMADRYTYIPSLGMLIFTVWGACELTRNWRHQVTALSVAGSVAIILCLGLTRQQLGYWQDGETLFRHALEVTENNYPARINLGAALYQKGQFEEAIGQLKETIRLKPDHADAHNNLGLALAKIGRVDEAISQYQEAIRLKPDNAETRSNLGIALYQKGQIDEAISQFQEAIRLKPDYAEAHNDLGVAFETKGRIDEAIGQFKEAIRLEPGNTTALNNLTNALELKSKSNVRTSAP